MCLSFSRVTIPFCVVHLRNLPTEILGQILSFLSGEDRKSARLVSSLFRQMIDSAKDSSWLVSDIVTVPDGDSEEGSSLEVASGFWQHSTLPFFVPKIKIKSTRKVWTNQIHKLVALLPSSVKNLRLSVRSAGNLSCLFAALPHTLKAFTFCTWEYDGSSVHPALCLLPPTLESLEFNTLTIEGDAPVFQLPPSLTTLELESLSGKHAACLPAKLKHLVIRQGDNLLLSKDSKLPDTLQKLEVTYAEVQLVPEQFAFLPHNPFCKTSLCFNSCDGLKQAVKALPPIHKITCWLKDTDDWLVAARVDKVVVIATGEGWNNLPPSCKSLCLENIYSIDQISHPKCNPQVTHLVVKRCKLAKCWDQLWVCLPNLTHLRVSGTDFHNIKWTDNLILSLSQRLMKLQVDSVSQLPKEFLQAMATQRPHLIVSNLS